MNGTVGDVSGGRLGRRGSFEDVLAYERAYGALSRRFAVTTLCLYDARRLSGVERLLHRLARDGAVFQDEHPQGFVQGVGHRLSHTGT